MLRSCFDKPLPPFRAWWWFVRAGVGPLLGANLSEGPPRPVCCLLRGHRDGSRVLCVSSGSSFPVGYERPLGRGVVQQYRRGARRRVSPLPVDFPVRSAGGAVNRGVVYRAGTPGNLFRRRAAITPPGARSTVASSTLSRRNRVRLLHAATSPSRAGGSLGLLPDQEHGSQRRPLPRASPDGRR